MALRPEVMNVTLRKCIVLLCEEVSDVVQNDIMKKKKRLWERKWISRRHELGASATLLRELATEDVKEFRNYMRLTTDQFNILLNKIKTKIQKSDTVMREAISAETKLHVTLSYLASGNSFRTAQRHFRVSAPAISKFIPEVCDAIYESLQNYIKVS